MLNLLRAGRISNQERGIILKELGREAQRRFNVNITTNQRGYNLDLFRDGLKFEPDIINFDNHYYVDYYDNDLNRIFEYFEYGTGLHNTKTRNRSPIVPSTKKFMSFIGTNKFAGQRIFTQEVQGVYPVFALKKTIKSMEADREYLQRNIRLKKGI